jgi:hypothetical protein
VGTGLTVGVGLGVVEGFGVPEGLRVPDGLGVAVVDGVVDGVAGGAEVVGSAEVVDGSGTAAELVCWVAGVEGAPAAPVLLPPRLTIPHPVSASVPASTAPASADRAGCLGDRAVEPIGVPPSSWCGTRAPHALSHNDAPPARSVGP